VEDVIKQLARAIRDRHYGKYRGLVTDAADPERRGRVRVKVPAIWGERVAHWALPCMPFGGKEDQGFFSVPESGAQVWVEFEGGDPNYPIWTGTFWHTAEQVPEDVQRESESAPSTRVYKTPKGHKLVLEDKDDEEQVHLEHSSGANLDIDSQGTLALTDAGGATVVLDAENNELRIEDANGNSLLLSSSGTTVEDAAGNKIEMAASGITVKGAKIVLDGSQVMLGGSGGEPIIKGQSFLSLFATHVHTCTAPGSPSSPPIPQGEFSTLSMKVMTS